MNLKRRTLKGEGDTSILRILIKIR